MRTVIGIFLAAAVVGVGHYGLTGMESIVSSVHVGVAGGFGALAMDIYRTLRRGSASPTKKRQSENADTKSSLR